jgi:hypothetical protein
MNAGGPHETRHCPLLGLRCAVYTAFGIGAGDGIRTRDIDLGEVALYQLSYSRIRQGLRKTTASILAPSATNVNLS